MAVAEAITNIASAAINQISDIKLSANWMAACGQAGQDAALFDAVKAIGMELCPQLGISIPVGKDSLSMHTHWKTAEAQSKSVTAPLSLIVSAFAPIQDVRQHKTPQLRTDCGDTVLIFIDLGRGKNRMGASILAQVLEVSGDVAPDLDHADDLKNFFAAVTQLHQQEILLAYHDRSDGGLLTTLAEMAFAGHTGITINLDILAMGDTHAADWGDAKNWTNQVAQRREDDTLRALFNEELGVVIQVKQSVQSTVMQIMRDHQLGACTHIIGKLNSRDVIEFTRDAKVIYSEERTQLQRIWTETSWQIARMRDNPTCADAEYNALLNADDAGMQVHLNFDPQQDITQTLAPAVLKQRPQLAILREQGVNSHVEAAAAFDRAGFTAIDVTMTDLLEQRVQLSDFVGFVAAGGFSYGDVLGAGGGWAKTILFNSYLRDQFTQFFARNDRFALGICNGCQMMSHLKELIPGAEHWPQFLRNQSEQFEARFAMVEVCESPSLFFTDMVGSRIPIVVAHGEGRAQFATQAQQQQAQVALRYIDHAQQITEQYPFNPNGSPAGITALTNSDGRFTIMMPHPERVFRTVQNSWHPDHWNEDSPWMRMFRNARCWVN